MDDGDPMIGALLTSFNALIAVGPPDRVVPVLRQAVTALLAEEPAPARGTPTLKPESR